MFRDEILEAPLSNNPRVFLSKTRLGERQERAGEAQDGHPEAQQEPSERSGVAPDHSTTHLNHLVGLGGAPSGFESEKLCVRSIRKVTPTTRTAENPRPSLHAQITHSAILVRGGHVEMMDLNRHSRQWKQNTHPYHWKSFSRVT